MLRLCLCLMIAVTSATAAAREVRLSAAGGSDDCPAKHSVAAKETAAADAGASATPARTSKPRPGVHGDANPSGRLQSPRWHSFLPGMFR